MAEGTPPGSPLVRESAPNRTTGWQLRQSSVIGGLLVVIGAILLIGQVVNIDVGHYGWPLIIIVPGVALMVVAVISRGFVSEGLSILGSILTVTGLILLYQNSTDHFESWAYAWALVFPGAVGLGMMLYGFYAGRPANLRAGARVFGVGAILFLLGAAFFEGVIGIGGYEFGRSAGMIIGVLIIGLGAALLILNVTSGRRGPA